VRKQKDRLIFGQAGLWALTKTQSHGEKLDMPWHVVWCLPSKCGGGSMGMLSVSNGVGIDKTGNSYAITMIEGAGFENFDVRYFQLDIL
jgi:hypothetical protein